MLLTEVHVRSNDFPDLDCYPFSVPAFRATERLRFSDRVVFFVGENGSGKSTLLEAIARRSGVHIWAKPKRHVIHHNRHEDRLEEFLSLSWEDGMTSGGLFRAESFRDYAEFLDDVSALDPGQLKYSGGRLLTTLSHGESILSYFRARYRVKGLYFLDEPEAALSPANQIELLRLLADLRERGHAQFLIATHSPLLLALPGAQIFSFGPDGIVETSWRETSHYRLYKDFLSAPEIYLRTNVRP